MTSDIPTSNQSLENGFGDIFDEKDASKPKEETLPLSWNIGSSLAILRRALNDSSVVDLVQHLAPPENQEAACYFSKTIANIDAGEFGQATQDLGGVIRIVPHESYSILQGLLYWAQAKFYLENNRITDARREFLKAVKLVPQHDDIQSFRSKLSEIINTANENAKIEQQRKIKEAQEEKERIEQEKRDAAEKQKDKIKRKQSEDQRKKNLERQEHLEKIKRERENAPVHTAYLLFEKSKNSAEMGNWSQAVDDLQQACRLDPKNPNYPEYHAKVRKKAASFYFEQTKDHLKQNDFNNAKKTIERTISFCPDHLEILKLRNHINEKIYDLEQLPNLFEKARIHLESGNIEQSREIYHSILKKFPGNQQAGEGLLECRSREVKRKLRIPARLFFLQWFVMNLLVVVLWLQCKWISNEISAKWLLLPLLLLLGPLMKSCSLSKLIHSDSLHVKKMEILYGLVVYFPFGWLGIFWMRILKAFDPMMKEAFRDQKTS